MSNFSDSLKKNVEKNVSITKEIETHLRSLMVKSDI